MASSVTFGNAPLPGSSDLSVRPARAEEAAAIAELHLSTREWAYAGLVPDEHMARVRTAIDRRIEMYAARISQPPLNSRTWVAEQAGKIVGFAMTGDSRDEGVRQDEGEVEAIYVAKDVVGTGVGRALMDRSITELRAQDYGEAILWVFEQNPRARRFYEAAGFKLDGGSKVQEWGGKPLRAVRYRFDLST